MVTEEEIREALVKVVDPEHGRSIVELGLVREIQLGDGELEVTLGLTKMNRSLTDKISDDIQTAIRGVDGGLIVNVRLTEMPPVDKERTRSEKATARSGMAAGFNDIRHVIAVMSGKGGVGKSSVAAMLAVTLRKQGQAVGVLDADITGPSIPLLFGVESVTGTSPMGLLPAVSSTGIKVMSINLLLPDKEEALVWRGPIISGAIKQFWGDVLWEALDTLILDLPPGTSDATLTVMQSIPLSGIVLVTTPQDLAGMIVRKAARMAQEMNIPILGLVENMSYLECPDCGRRIELFGPSQADEMAQSLGVPLLGCLPLDPELALRCDNGQVELYAGELFSPVARLVLERLPEAKTRPIWA